MMSQEALEARRAYKREWAQKNRDKTKNTKKLFMRRKAKLLVKALSRKAICRILFGVQSKKYSHLLQGVLREIYA